MRRLAVAQTPVKDHQLQNSLAVLIINNNIIINNNNEVPRPCKRIEKAMEHEGDNLPIVIGAFGTVTKGL